MFFKENHGKIILSLLIATVQKLSSRITNGSLRKVSQYQISRTNHTVYHIQKYDARTILVYIIYTLLYCPLNSQYCTGNLLHNKFISHDQIQVMLQVVLYSYNWLSLSGLTVTWRGCSQGTQFQTCRKETLKKKTSQKNLL